MLWGHSKHLVSSVMSPAGDRPPEALGLDSVSAHTQRPRVHPLTARPGPHLVRGSVSISAGPASHAGTQIHSVAYTHTCKHTHTPNTNYYEPSGSPYMLETVSAHNETPFLHHARIILQAVGLCRCGTPTPLTQRRAFWQVTDSCVFP